MPVTDLVTDAEDLTLTITADFAAPIERVWQVYSDPEQLSRFWGPPMWPATFWYFDQQVGGFANYTMHGPRGETASGRWEFLKINEPTSFEVLDCFTDDEGNPSDELPPMRMTFEFTPTGTGTRMVSKTYFVSIEALEAGIAMGMIEGTGQAMAQIDAVLQDLREFAQGKGTQLELLDDTHVRITRLINGPRELVWRAYNEEELVRQWMLGPDGWEITDMVVGTKPGDKHLTSWAPTGDTPGEAFGFEGEVLLVDEPSRAVTTERMQGVPEPETINDLNLYEENGATLVTLVIEYPDKDTRDMILATGMVDGMEVSYERLDELVAQK